MPTITELKAQREALDAQIKAATQTERTDAIAKVKMLMEENGLTLADLGKGRAGKSPKRTSTAPAKKVAAKYRDKSGNSWSGRGLQPNWLKAAVAAGKKVEEFAVK